MRKLVVDSCVISASGLVYFIFGCRYLDKQENYYIIAGDFNAKHTSWKNEINNTRGKSVRTWLDNKSIFYKTNLYSSELPSYPKGRSYLDICLADARIKFQNLRPNNTLKTIDYDSDHSKRRPKHPGTTTKRQTGKCSKTCSKRTAT